MEDEEYSYSSYSAGTKAEMEGRQAEYRESEEVYSYSAYGGESESAEEEGFTKSYGDYIVEEFSSETNVPRIAKLTGIPANIVNYIYAGVYLIVGIICLALTSQVTRILPYIVGGMMIFLGVSRFIFALKTKEYRSLSTNMTATSLIITALGVMIILEHLDPDSEWAITFISIVWGILGLFESAHAFNHAFKRIANSERCIYYLIKGIVECVVAFMLLYHPEDHEIHHFHIIVFGVNLIFDSITMIPQVKTFLSMK